MYRLYVLQLILTGKRRIILSARMFLYILHEINMKRKRRLKMQSKKHEETGCLVTPVRIKTLVRLCVNYISKSNNGTHQINICVVFI